MTGMNINRDEGEGGKKGSIIGGSRGGRWGQLSRLRKVKNRKDQPGKKTPSWGETLRNMYSVYSVESR